MLQFRATIADVLPTLSDAEEYLRGVLQRLHEHSREHPDIWVRIGLTGDGKVPHYRIDTREEREVLFGDSTYTQFTPLAAYRGAGHRSLVPPGEEPDILRDEHWSMGALSKADVMRLLGQVRTGRSGT